MVRKTFGELINLVIASVLIIALLMAGYLIFANIYHSQELKYDYAILEETKSKKALMVSDIISAEEKLNNMNFNAFDDDKKVYYVNMQLYLQNCIQDFKESKYYIEEQTTADALVNYNYYSEFRTKIYGECLSYEFSNIKNVQNNSTYVDKNFDTYMSAYNLVAIQLSESAEMIAGILSGNSSYNYTTFETRWSIYNPTKIIYEQITNDYYDASLIVTGLTNYLETVIKEGTI